MKKRRKLITVQDKIKEVLHKQKKAKDSAIGATNCEIRELFPYMAPIFYEDFVEMLTEEQTK